jgi:lysophospholipase L1-like esterase
MSTPSASFAEFDRRARAHEALNVVFLGGSLTFGAVASDPMQTSYRALIGKRLREYYDNPRITSHDAAIGGTGSHLGIFRLDRDVFRHEPDLVFVEFAVNDHPFSIHPGRLEAYEAIVRRLVLAGIPVVQGLLAVKQDLAPDPVEKRVLDPEHKKISHAYNTGLGDAVTLMRAQVAAGQASADDLWHPFDGTHPNDAGYALYAEAMWNGFRQAVDEKRVCRAPGKMLHPDTFTHVTRQKISALAPLPAGWNVGIPTPWGCAFDFYMSRWFDDVMIAEGPDAKPLQLTFNGSTVLLFGEATRKSGKLQVKIDGKIATTEGSSGGLYDLHADGMHFARIVAENLDPARPHTLDIVPVLEKDQELRLESICVAGGAATVAIAR